MDSLQDSYQTTRKMLDECGYKQSFSIESTILVKTLLKDLREVSHAFMKTKQQVRSRILITRKISFDISIFFVLKECFMISKSKSSGKLTLLHLDESYT